ncbi:MAG TPA: NTP transferase domain-containing protein [Candidatus Cloacimonadota bacterium]|nr:NTP transferase domain-containing protein [Candidatus Cloacimonadota bacterium]
MQRLNICAIILASGKGLRFGGPKAEALLETGESFLERAENLLRDIGLSCLRSVVNRDTPDMLSSLRLGVSECPDMDAYLVFPVDFPFVKKETILSLLQAACEYPGIVIKPTYRGDKGHPIIIPGNMDLSPEEISGGLAELIYKQGLTVLDLPVDDPGILRNVNYPIKPERKPLSASR